MRAPVATYNAVAFRCSLDSMAHTTFLAPHSYPQTDTHPLEAHTIRAIMSYHIYDPIVAEYIFYVVPPSCTQT